MCKRVHFWHRSRLRHDLLQWDALPFWKKCTCWREHSLQRDASLLFKGILQSVWICVNSRVWANNVNIKINSTHSLAAYVFAFVQHSVEKIYKRTKLPNLCPKPPKLPPVIPAFCHCIFTWFSNGTTGPKQPTKSSKSKFATPKVGELAKSEVSVLHFCVALPTPQKTNNEPENRETKRPKTKKTKKQETKKLKKNTKFLTPRNPIFVTFMSRFFFPLFLFALQQIGIDRPTDMQQINNCFSK